MIVNKESYFTWIRDKSEIRYSNKNVVYLNFHKMSICTLKLDISCEFFISDFNECSSLPCQNGGLCINEVGSYRCECTIAYDGTNCEIRK